MTAGTAERPVSERAEQWAATMHGGAGPSGVRTAHSAGAGPRVRGLALGRSAREDLEDRLLAPGATRASGAGDRARPEEPDAERTCFERDRDRVVHSTAFRRLAGKTQVFVFPDDHQRTRLTHALEVAQVASAIARDTGLNVALTEAIALSHDCGHGPGGHASEDAFDPFIPGGYHHAVWGADVVLAPLNLCAETLDGVRNHSWSRPAPRTPEAVAVSWADRIAYTAHDLEDAASAGIVRVEELPRDVVATLGATRQQQLRTLIGAVVSCIREHGFVGMATEPAEALAALRAFNYERIYTRPESLAQAAAVIDVLRALVSYYAEDRSRLPEPPVELDELAVVQAAVAYVGGMTDRYAFDTAQRLLGWDAARLPVGIGVARG